MKNRKWAINNDWTKPNFVTNFECCVCERLHEQMMHSKEGAQLRHQAVVEHYGCPKPTQFSDSPPGSLAQKDGGDWASEWEEGRHRAQAVAQLIAENRRFSTNDVDNRAYKLRYPWNQNECCLSTCFHEQMFPHSSYRIFYSSKICVVYFPFGSIEVA